MTELSFAMRSVLNTIDCSDQLALESISNGIKINGSDFKSTFMEILQNKDIIDHKSTYKKLIAFDVNNLVLQKNEESKVKCLNDFHRSPIISNQQVNRLAKKNEYPKLSPAWRDILATIGKELIEVLSQWQNGKVDDRSFQEYVLKNNLSSNKGEMKNSGEFNLAQIGIPLSPELMGKIIDQLSNEEISLPERNIPQNGIFLVHTEKDSLRHINRSEIPDERKHLLERLDFPDSKKVQFADNKQIDGSGNGETVEYFSKENNKGFGILWFPVNLLFNQLSDNQITENKNANIINEKGIHSLKELYQLLQDVSVQNQAGEISEIKINESDKLLFIPKDLMSEGIKENPTIQNNSSQEKVPVKQQVVNQITDRIIRLVETKGELIPKNVSVQLKPEYLGTVQLNVENTVQGVKCAVQIENPELRQAVKAKLPIIHRTIQEQNIRLDQIDIQQFSGKEQQKIFDQLMDDKTGDGRQGYAKNQSGLSHTVTDTKGSISSTTQSVENQASKNAGNPVVHNTNDEQFTRYQFVKGDELSRSSTGNSAKNMNPSINTQSTTGEKVLFSKHQPIRQIMDHLVQSVRLRKRPGTTQIRVQLKPEHLGMMRILVEDTGREVKGIVQIENSQVRQSFEAQLPVIQKSFQEQNIRLDRLEVQNFSTYMNQQDDSNQMKQNFQQSTSRMQSQMQKEGMPGSTDLSEDQETRLLDRDFGYNTLEVTI